jgi:DNA polymerase-3 subunit epsilon
MQEEAARKIQGGIRTTGAMKTPDLVFVDIETTGADPYTHEIIEISVIRVKQEWKPADKPVFTVIEEWSTKILPENIASADPAALRINGYTVTRWNDAIRIKPALEEFARRTEKAIMVSHNVAFDAGFLEAYMSSYCIPSSMHYHRLDTVSMAFAKLHSDPAVLRFSLAELAKHFGITTDGAHSALPDARTCFEIFKRLIES